MRGNSPFTQISPASAKVIGLIGGISPETTALYYRTIQERYRVRGAASSPRILLHSVDGERLERCRLTGETDASLIEMLLAAAHRLRNDGAQCLALCADNLHSAAERVAALLPDDVYLPVAVDALGSALEEADLRRIALLGFPSDSPHRAYLVHTLADRFAIETVGVAAAPIISQPSASIPNDFPPLPGSPSLSSWIHSLSESDVDAIVLGSTEMALLFPPYSQRLPIPCIAAVEHHAEAIVEAAFECHSPHLPASFGAIGEYLYDAA